MSSMGSKWDINKAVKRLELYGDIRVRYEYREAVTPLDARMEDERFRYALRVGLRGDLFDDVYFGLRLETSTNPRSPWVTFGGFIARDRLGSPAAGLMSGRPTSAGGPGTGWTSRWARCPTRCTPRPWFGTRT